jgi:cellulose synthase/poly-beta-1,6-N-acetylglucosamine synthase-like glycosyltransferase
MELLLWFIVAVGTVFFGVPVAYYLYLWRSLSKPWNLVIDKLNLPPVTILVPAHNEEKTIGLKLLNLSGVKYEKAKMQILVVDDKSSDNTIKAAESFIRAHPELEITVIEGRERTGKSVALNNALKYAKHDVVIVTDADTFWSHDILMEALPFFSDKSVGALNGRQTLLGCRKNLSTQTERAYLDLTYGLIKLGESKIHSTIIYHGLFSAYSRRYLRNFNLETDDSGTALDIVQNGGRAIFVPAAKCFEIPTSSWKGKVETKLRRANRLLAIYAKCFELLVKGKLKLPLRIALPEIFIYFVNPILFVLLTAALLLFLANNLFYLLIAGILLSILLIVPSKFRLIFFEAVQDHVLLLLAIFSLISGNKFSMWETLDDSRSLLDERMLKENNLI